MVDVGDDGDVTQLHDRFLFGGEAGFAGAIQGFCEESEHLRRRSWFAGLLEAKLPEKPLPLPVYRTGAIAGGGTEEGDGMRLVIVLAALAASGCVSVSETRTSGPAMTCQQGQPMVETMLFLGMARPNGSVSRYEFSQFVEAEVATRWKEGFTIVEANGVWFSEQRHITEHEPSRILIRFHDGSATASADIEAIRNAYIKQFTQDAVLRTDRMTCADF